MIDYLNAQRDCQFWGELLNPRSNIGLPASANVGTCIDHVTKMLNRIESGPRGFKLLLSHLRFRKISFSQLVQGMPGSKFLFLFRRDLLATYVSMKRGIATGHWMGTEDIAVPFQPTEFLKFATTIKWQYQRLFESPGIRNRSLVVSYEDLRQNPEELFETQVCPFLGVNYTPLEKKPLIKGKDLLRTLSNPADAKRWLSSPYRYLGFDQLEGFRISS